MKFQTPPIIPTDVLVIGSGMAGLRAAIQARERGCNVALVSESPVGFRSNSAVSGAILAATGIDEGSPDSPERHIEDTLNSGRLVNDRKLVATMVRGAANQVYDLVRFGVSFRQRHGKLLVWQVPGHTYPRHVSALDWKGVNITRPMRRHAASIGIQFMEGILVIRLLTAEGRAVGALGIDDRGRVLAFNARSTILATGGAGHIYLRTNNASGMTGDGFALAYGAGATLRDMEFVQFYPTTTGKYGSKLTSYEILMPKGATLKNSLDEDIVKKHGGGSFAPTTRDVLARWVMTEVREGRGVDGGVIFDLTTMPADVAEKLYLQGFPPKFQVAPAAHFFMGGVRIDEKANTGIDGLFAAGEVCGGIHGANRLAGNAITETLVFGAIAGDSAAALASRVDRMPVPGNEIYDGVNRLRELASGSGQENVDEIRQSLKRMMWDRVGVLRDGKSLETARRGIVSLREQFGRVSVTDSRHLRQAVKLDNMLTVSEIVCRAALTRTESRGAHYRTDYPAEDDDWLKIIEVSRQSGEMELEVVPVTG